MRPQRIEGDFGLKDSVVWFNSGAGSEGDVLWLHTSEHIRLTYLMTFTECVDPESPRIPLNFRCLLVGHGDIDVSACMCSHIWEVFEIQRRR